MTSRSAQRALLFVVLGCAPALPAQGRPEQERPAPERPATARPRPERVPIALRPAQLLPLGTFVATRIDREELPLADRVVDDDGTLYLIEFDRLVLTLREDFTFRASVRYRRSLFAADPRGRARPTPLQSMAVTGRWEIEDTQIRFIPDPSHDSKGLRMLSGTMGSVRDLTVPFHYRNGTQERERTLVLRRRDDIL